MNDPTVAEIKVRRLDVRAKARHLSKLADKGYRVRTDAETCRAFVYYEGEMVHATDTCETEGDAFAEALAWLEGQS